jgi:ribosomal protein S27AE
MKCKDCGQDILQAHPQICPYCKSKNLIADEDASKEIHEIEQLAKAGRYEDAALRYEKLDLWDKAKECRMLAKKKKSGSLSLETGKVGTINVVCPHCGASKPVTAQADKETCSRCGTTYLIPSRVSELIAFDEKS